MLLFLFAWGAPNPNANPLVSLLTLLLPMILIFYFLMIRPQAKRQKQHRTMLENLTKGDNVVGAGGIYGTIAGIKEKENIVILKVDNNVKIEVTKSSISSVIPKE